MNWSGQIFLYCERGANLAFWAEPLNALSNAAFLIAAVAALMAWAGPARGARGSVELVLIVIVAVIGVGSFLFHTLATRWASLADTLPITAFMLAYLAYALVRFVRLTWLSTGLLLAAFVAAMVMAGSMRCGAGPCLNGSLGYVPALIALGITGSVLNWREHAAGPFLLWGALLLAVSLTFRTIDRAICPWTAITASGPIGTHFAWHLLNGLLLYLLLAAAIRYGRTLLA